MPKHLPKFDKNSDAPGRALQEERLLQWLRDWSIFRSLGDSDRSDLETGEETTDFPISAFDESPEVGDIRLLSHEIAGETARPIYVAVVRQKTKASEEEADQYLVLPFGIFSRPATPGEMTTGLDDPRFAVVQTWNGRFLEKGVLAFSWCVEKLPVSLCNKLHRHFRALIRGFEFDADIDGALGPPLVHEEDPRWEYLEAERALLCDLDATCRASSIRGSEFDVDIEDTQEPLTVYEKDPVSEYLETERALLCDLDAASLDSLERETIANVIEFPIQLACIAAAAASAEDRRIKVYWHKGDETDFIERLPNLTQGPELYGETALLNWNVEQPEETIGEWELTGETLPQDGAKFKILDPEPKTWIGSGTIQDLGRTAVLLNGLWQDFQPYQSQTSSLVLVIFEPGVE